MDWLIENTHSPYICYRSYVQSYEIKMWLTYGNSTVYINRERSSTQYIIKMLKSPHTAPVILEILVTCAVLSSSSESHPSSKMKSQSLYYRQIKHINTKWLILLLILLKVNYYVSRKGNITFWSQVLYWCAWIANEKYTGTHFRQDLQFDDQYLEVAVSVGLQVS